MSQHSGLPEIVPPEGLPEVVLEFEVIGLASNRYFHKTLARHLCTVWDAEMAEIAGIGAGFSGIDLCRSGAGMRFLVRARYVEKSASSRFSPLPVSP